MTGATGFLWSVAAGVSTPASVVVLTEEVGGAASFIDDDSATATAIGPSAIGDSGVQTHASVFSIDGVPLVVFIGGTVNSTDAANAIVRAAGAG